jgi:transposase
VVGVVLDDFLVNDAIEVGSEGGRAKRIHRTAEEKRRIVELTLVPGASIARVARENGVNANQVFQWRYEHRRGIGWAAGRTRAELLPVTLTSEPDSMVTAEAAPVAGSCGSIHIELPGRGLVTIENGVDPTLVRAVLGSLLR